MSNEPVNLEEFINSGRYLTEPLPPVIDSPVVPEAPAVVQEEENIAVNCDVGDVEAVEQHEQPAAAEITIPEHFLGLDIKDPVELLMMLDDDISSGRVQLHPWQIQILIDFAAGGESDDYPLQQVVRACNGSGKDKYVIAPCVVWLCMRYKKARGVVTSSSGQQLDSQTGTYIDELCNSANRKFSPMFGGNIWKVNYRYYECLLTGSPIDMFATDEPKKAEGYHPLAPDAKMAILVSEDKSVPDEINIALNRCTGYTHRLHVSTPGQPMGHFHDYCALSVPRKAIQSIKEVKPTDWIQYHVTAYDCSHLSRSYIEQMKRDLPGGEIGVAFRSIVLAEFGSSDEMVVIPYTYVWKAINGSKFGHKTKQQNDAGLDLSDGGDETVLAVRNGNRLIHINAFRFDNTEDTVAYLDEQFRRFELNNPQSKINADCGGLGKPILDRLKRMGWTNIYYIDNRNTPHEPRTYKNRAAELWFKFRKLLELNEIWLLDDHKLKKQLSTRFYTITPENKHQLESKIKARANGHPSPDRADACILCFWDYEQISKPTAVEKPFELPKETRKPVGVFTQNEYIKNKDRHNEKPNPSRGINFSSIRDLIQEYNREQKSKQTQQSELIINE